jgi:hypothetical protein
MSQGTLTLWFHENKDKDGNPSDKVYGVSNCHVLRKDTTVEYEHRGGAPKDHVRVCGMRRFQRGLDEIKKVIGGHGILADLLVREIVKLEAKERQDAESAKAIRVKRRKLEDANEAIADLEALYNEVTKSWSDIKFHRNIGHVQYAAAITVDVEGGTLYTSDWAAFLAAEAKVKDKFKGNVVDLGAFRLIFLIFPSSNENNLIQDLSILLQNLRRCSVLWVVVRPRSSFPRRESSGSRVAPRKRTSPTPQSSTAKASAALSSVKTVTLPTSPSDATPAWSHSLSTKSASSPSSSESTTRASRMPKPSPPRETRAPSSGTRRTAKLASLANSTLEVTKAARPATILLIAPLAGTSWTRSGRSSSTPTSTAPPGQLENNIVGFLLSISTLLLLLRLVLLSRRSAICLLVFGVDRCFDRWVAIKVCLFLPRRSFILIADDVEAWPSAIPPFG